MNAARINSKEHSFELNFKGEPLSDEIRLAMSPAVDDAVVLSVPSLGTASFKVISDSPPLRVELWHSPQSLSNRYVPVVFHQWGVRGYAAGNDAGRLG